MLKCDFPGLDGSISGLNGGSGEPYGWATVSTRSTTMRRMGRSSGKPESRRARPASPAGYKPLHHRQAQATSGHYGARLWSAGEHAQDMGPYFRAVCTDDQGTTFGVMSAVLE